MSERDIEVPWAIALAESPILDVGCAESNYLHALPQPVDGIDVRAPRFQSFRRFFYHDIRTFVPPERYRTVLAISTIEHVGLAHDPYGTDDDDPDGDRHALEACVAAGETVLVSVPFGAPRDYGWFRQYDEERLKRLCDDFEASWVIHGGPRWLPIGAKDADEWEYDHERCSARAVALITIGGIVAEPRDWGSIGLMRRSGSSFKETQFSKDRDAYQRLRAQGLQPPNIDGCAKLEKEAVTRDEIVTGVIKGGQSAQDRKKEAALRREAVDRARELMA